MVALAHEQNTNTAQQLIPSATRAAAAAVMIVLVWALPTSTKQGRLGGCVGATGAFWLPACAGSTLLLNAEQHTKEAY